MVDETYSKQGRRHCLNISHGNCQDLGWNLGAGKEKYLCVSVREKVGDTVYRLEWRHANGSDSNEIICIISTDNYTLITKIHKGNEHNYVADTVGQWTYYLICIVVYKNLLLNFILSEIEMKDFIPIPPLKFWKTEKARGEVGP